MRKATKMVANPYYIYQDIHMSRLELTKSARPRIFRHMQAHRLISANSIIAKRLWLALPAHCRSALLF